MCLLNGRTYIKDDFTFISPKGCAVVDYCIVAHDSLNHFKDFTVIRSTEMISNIQVNTGLIPVSIPDHSILTWMVEFYNYSENVYTQYSNPVCEAISFDKFDLKSVSDTFLNTHDVFFSLF
jgi:hypothetical protein